MNGEKRFNPTENEVFNKLKKVIPDLTRTGEFDAYDCFSKKYNLHLEIKTRTRHWDELGIEKPKYDKLIQHKVCRYIVATPKGMWSWNLHKVKEPDWIQRVGPTSTMHQHLHNIQEVLKTFGYLNIKDGKDISHLL